MTKTYFISHRVLYQMAKIYSFSFALKTILYSHPKCIFSEWFTSTIYHPYKTVLTCQKKNFVYKYSTYQSKFISLYI